jgi:hypothetical protein|tara:strand:+ start:13793 stop:14074 length:282 start_codon:yes stop_codon:yes gene_type:complete
MKRPYLFDKLEIPEEHRVLEPQIRLWRAVLDRQLQDIVSEESTPEAEQFRLNAKVFMRGNSEDFWEVCYLACLEPSHVQYITRIVIGEDILYD